MDAKLFTGIRQMQNNVKKLSKFGKVKLHGLYFTFGPLVL